VEIKILSANKKIFQGKSDKITLPGEEGQFQVLENHADIFALLGEGEIVIGEYKKIPIFSGIVEVLSNKAVVLVEESRVV
jgi:F-type H+-transporting ATPase subunit epsilon